MKRVLSTVLALIMVLSLSTAAFAVDTHSVAGKLTARETKIVKAYLKSLETFDAKYLNAVKYPGVTFESPTLSEGATIKVLHPVFTKTKDADLKLNRIDVSGLLVVSSSEKLALAEVVQGIAVKTSKKQLYAFQEVDVKTNEIKAISDLDEGMLTDLTAHLTDLYGEETAKTLISEYTAGAFSEDGSSEDSDIDDSSSEDDAAVTPTPTSPR